MSNMIIEPNDEAIDKALYFACIITQSGENQNAFFQISETLKEKGYNTEVIVNSILKATVPGIVFDNWDHLDDFSPEKFVDFDPISYCSKFR